MMLSQIADACELATLVKEARRVRVIERAAGLATVVALRKVQQLIGVERRWCRLAFATGRHPRLHRRVSCHPMEPIASQWCLHGACTRVAIEMSAHAGGFTRYELQAMMSAALGPVAFELFGEAGLGVLNDCLGFDAVHVTLDAAMRATRARVASLPA